MGVFNESDVGTAVESYYVVVNAEDSAEAISRAYPLIDEEVTLNKGEYFSLLARPNEIEESAYEDELYFLLTDIEYDERNNGLPKALLYKASTTLKDQLELDASDYISSTTGFCHTGFKIKQYR
ncbi:hypothetical protein A3715_10655 [Oleiphilus sp. HI0009]|nr:hypothetical protein A3715_10655 [Oleiphilus sp. HI0009]